MYPEEYLYTEEHEWLQVDGDTYTLGITAFAQQELGEVVFVDLPEVGATFDAGDEIGTLESVKAVAEFYAPTGGEVVEVNSELEDKPELINEEPHAAGWICKIKMSDQSPLSELMNAEAYAKTAQSD